MSNGYFTHDAPLARHTLARAEALNAALSAVEAGFDRLPPEAALKEGRVTYGAVSGTVNSYAVTLPYAPAAYTEGMRVSFRVPAGAGNSGASAVNVNGLGVKPLLRIDGAPTVSGDLPAGAVIDLCYDGTAFRLAGAHGGDVRRAQEWAAKTGAPVADGEYSSKEHAVGTTVPGGSARHHAEAASVSAAAASASAAAASTSATSAADSAGHAADSAAAAAASAAGVNLPPVTPDDAGKVLTVTGGGTLAAVAPFVPGIATAAAAGLVKGGGNVGIAVDGTMTATMSVKINDVSVGAGITALNFVGTTLIDGGVSSGVATIIVGAVPYRYLRITATASSHSTSFGLYYMDWRTVRVYASVNATGTNLALGLAASASSTAVGRTPEAALDADDLTRWGTTNAPASLGWYQIDFGATGLSVIPGSMTIYPADDGTNPYLPTKVIIGLSRDMATWVSTSPISTSSSTGTQAFTNLQFG